MMLLSALKKFGCRPNSSVMKVFPQLVELGTIRIGFQIRMKKRSCDAVFTDRLGSGANATEREHDGRPGPVSRLLHLDYEPLFPVNLFIALLKAESDIHSDSFFTIQAHQGNALKFGPDALKQSLTGDCAVSIDKVQMF